MLILYYSQPLLGLLYIVGELTMRTQLVFIIPILAAMIGMFAIVGLNSVNAQNMSTPETNMSRMSNATMGGNMTSGNATSENMADPLNITTP